MPFAPTWTDGIDFDARSFQLTVEFVSEENVGELGVLVRLQSVECILSGQEKVLDVQVLHDCEKKMLFWNKKIINWKRWMYESETNEWMRNEWINVKAMNE